jgi:hypothetical protein
MKLSRLVLLLTSIVLAPTSILACTCNVRPPACFEYWRTEAVFIGTVRKVNRITETSTIPLETVELSVDESFKGVTSPRIATFNYGHSCAFTFEAGESFLFYGGLDKTNRDEFGTSFCHRTTRLKDGLVDLEFLRAIKNDTPVYWAWGTISELGYDVPLEGIRAEVLGQGKKIEGASNIQGDIRLEVPKPGTYKIRIHLPSGRADINGLVRNEMPLWEMQRKQIIGGRFKGPRPYVDYQVQVAPNRCGWFDVSIPRDR